jgi:hypothetical protein
LAPLIFFTQDLGSILTFLKICAPLDNEDFFKRLVLRPLKDANPDGAQLLSVSSQPQLIISDFLSQILIVVGHYELNLYSEDKGGLLFRHSTCLQGLIKYYLDAR